MRGRFLSLFLVLVVGGCASTKGSTTFFYERGQEKKLVRAVEMLERKNLGAAAELLTALATEPGVPGVTDEALFRLSLLHLGAEKNGVMRARQDLDRMRKEYPASSWTPLASLLVATLADEQTQIRKLKELNLSLTRDNRELRQTIERLRSLELELGKGSKH